MCQFSVPTITVQYLFRMLFQILCPLSSVVHSPTTLIFFNHFNPIHSERSNETSLCTNLCAVTLTCDVQTLNIRSYPSELNLRFINSSRFGQFTFCKCVSFHTSIPMICHVVFGCSLVIDTFSQYVITLPTILSSSAASEILNLRYIYYSAI